MKSVSLSVLLTCLLVFTAARSVAEETTSQKVEGGAAAKPSEGEDWPEFLGSDQYGRSSETGLLKSWPEQGPPLLWQKEIGAGYSAPSVRGDRLVVHHREGDREIVECVNVASAETEWKYETPTSFSDPFGYNNGPRCTPLLTEAHCYTYGAQGRLLCLELANGKLVWERETQRDFNVPEAFFGVGATPILEGNTLIVLVGGQPEAGVVAFDASTGETLWQNVGKSTWDQSPTGWPNPKTYEWTGEEMVVSYATPIAATIHGKRHVLCFMRHGLVSLDPETGKERFHYWFRSRDHESVNAARPVVVGDKIFLSAAYRVGSVLLEVNEQGSGVREVWRDPRGLSAHWTTPIPDDGYLYGFDGRHENEATLQCIQLETGELQWKSDGWEKPTDHLQAISRSAVRNTKTDTVEAWPYYGRGSAILAEGQLIVLGERGTLALVEANPDKFVEISRFRPEGMTYPCWAAPVLSRGRLFLRCENAVVCYDLKRR
ncbi:PQQ-binding-like beta-propeller repeat protein [Rubinisphaera brasiliensis]|uniref:Pyrrolo-quinoline quinone repeat domain-containing protein n=1 Tax=Rubinisphaera brasiliensis (strain ATCC 49424 / DSM 5305 / JCM 21570 / IAM 15109 / NBRC 103401 / IFAM 1448) TaxID=756272 RepID=F0SPQ9_RUBBR|nr:PQQ-binding-like beta-propeller repeat protein [Rubinisphaera brasiliensis]ADY59018.1 hypothetical protein Plabr_1406 [Rubinisphaera brasiliensis DSM 5305]